MSAAVKNNGLIANYVDIAFPNAIDDIFDSTDGLPIDKMQIGDNASSLGFVENQMFHGYRLVGGHGVDPQSPEMAELFLVPRVQTQKMSETFGTQFTSMSKLGFEERTFQGIDGYKVFAGLTREAHRVVDGLPNNAILYPGNKAMGTKVEILPPLIRSINISLLVRPKDGVTLNSISDSVKSSVSSYVNSLGVGKAVIISAIIRLVQGLPGVYSVSVESTTPAASDDRVVVNDIEKAFVLNSATDILVG
jgi:hypothetical protein